MKKSFLTFSFFFLCLVLLFTLIFFTTRPDQKLTVAFLDIGQGDAIFIQTPEGKQMLVDGGPSGPLLLRRLGEVMPFYDRSIDIVLATHPDADHIGGLNSVLENFTVDTFIRTLATSTSAVFKNLIQIINEEQISEKIIRAPEVLDLGSGVAFDILFPDQDTSGWETNDSSIVAKLIYKQNSFLLTGDAPSKIERELVLKYGDHLQSDVLKVGHHGSKYSTSALFVRFVAPEYAVISAGLNNRYGHPTKEVIDVLNLFGVKIKTTLGQGSLIFKSDGEGIILLPQLSSK